jgi:DegV family protein with EDD domain
MSNSVVVITDSTASLPPELYTRYGILMVPYYVHIEGRPYRDMVDILPTDFNRYLASLADDAPLPKSANPGPGDYLEAFRLAAERGREIVTVHMTSIGSGAYQAALAAREMAAESLRHLHIHVVDTRNVSMCHGWMALQAARAAAAGLSVEEILALIARMMPLTRMIQTADTLRYLYMGGRIGRAKHLVSTLLNIKPLISMEEGEIVTLGVVRTRRRALERMVELIQRAMGGEAAQSHPVRLAYTHAAAEGEVSALRALAEGTLRVAETLVCELCPALAVHTGPGTVGLCYTPADFTLD